MASPSTKKQKTSSAPLLEDADGIPVPQITDVDYVNLTTHSGTFGVDPIPISWGHPDPLVRGPVICTVRHNNQRNAIGAHSGSYCIYTGLAVAAGKLSPEYVPKLKLTRPVTQIGVRLSPLRKVPFVFTIQNRPSSHTLSCALYHTLPAPALQKLDRPQEGILYRPLRAHDNRRVRQIP